MRFPFARLYLSAIAWLPLLLIARQFDRFALQMALLAGVLWCLWWWRRHWLHYRGIANQPTARIASAAQGYAELFGRSRRDGEMAISPLTHLPCLWYSYRRLEQQRKDRVLGALFSSSQLADSGQSSQAFLLDDGSGVVQVDPVGALITTSHYDEYSIDGRRYGEWVLLEQDSLYVLGELRSVRAVSAPEQALAQKLGEWKADRSELLRRYDRDGDGQIDQQEWEAARRDASNEVSAQLRSEAVQAPRHQISRPSDGRPYLISNQAPETLSRHFRLAAWLHLLMALIALACLWTFAHQQADWLLANDSAHYAHSEDGAYADE